MTPGREPRLHSAGDELYLNNYYTQFMKIFTFHNFSSNKASNIIDEAVPEIGNWELHVSTAYTVT